jgi:hypothetical protein
MAVGGCSFSVSVKKGNREDCRQPLERLGQYVSGGRSLISEENSSEDADNV